MQDRAWLNCQWSVQEQQCRRSQLASHVVSFWTSHKRFEQLYWMQWSHDVKTLNSCIECSDHMMSKPWTVVLNSVITWCQNLEHWDSTVSLTLIILLQPEMCGEFLIYAHFIFTVGNTINSLLPVLLPLSWPEESALPSPVWLHVLSPAQLPDSVSWSRNNIISDH
jgi:hypothetical protein